MCRESDGLGAYERSGITHLHLPTPDVCEPRYEDILRGVRTIKDFLKSQESERERQSQESEREREREEGESQERSQDGGKGNEAQLDNQQHQHSVFIHCKAGRGRAAAITLCTIFALDPAYPDIDSAMKRILERRPVVEQYVQNFQVVQKFRNRLCAFTGDVEALYLSDIGGINNCA
mmetsp:Transcript_25396/g.56243  ORF Transcript_25396/g.56243 Transcript_25396/m.56243 type:complete len:177 (-) Transcript_25396:994-1524(-)